MDASQLTQLIVTVVQIVVVMGLVILAVPILVLMERKVIGFMQSRIGPKRVGPSGALQTIADGIKLLLKEDIIPDRADKMVFRIAPIIVLMPALAAFAVVPLSGTSLNLFGLEIKPWVTDINIGVLFILAITSVGILDRKSVV